MPLAKKEGTVGGWSLPSPWSLLRISSAPRTFVRNSAEVRGKPNVDASLVVLSKCRNQDKGGGRERRRNEPSNPPTAKDG